MALNMRVGTLAQSQVSETPYRTQSQKRQTGATPAIRCGDVGVENGVECPVVNRPRWRRCGVEPVRSPRVCVH